MKADSEATVKEKGKATAKLDSEATSKKSTEAIAKEEGEASVKEDIEVTVKEDSGAAAKNESEATVKEKSRVAVKKEGQNSRPCTLGLKWLRRIGRTENYKGPEQGIEGPKDCFNLSTQGTPQLAR